MKKKKKRVATETSEESLGHNPFGDLDASGLALSGKKVSEHEEKAVEKKGSKRGRVAIRREKTGRGGKTVTVIEGLVGAHEGTEHWLKHLQTKCGSGGTLKGGGVLEIQGDKRERVRQLLEEAGFRVVFSGG